MLPGRIESWFLMHWRAEIVGCSMHIVAPRSSQYCYAKWQNGSEPFSGCNFSFIIVPKIQKRVPKMEFRGPINVAVICYRHKRKMLFPINSNHHKFHQKGPKRHKRHWFGQNASHARQIPQITMAKNTILAKINIAVNLHRHKRQNSFAINSKQPKNDQKHSHFATWFNI